MRTHKIRYLAAVFLSVHNYASNKPILQVNDIIGNISYSALLWNLPPYPCFTRQLPHCWELSYGLSNSVCYYPVNLNYKDLKIGFFCFDVRPFEWIINDITRGLQKNYVRKAYNILTGWIYFPGTYETSHNGANMTWSTFKKATIILSHFAAQHGCYFYLLSMKLKFIRMNFFDVLKILRIFVFRCQNAEDRIWIYALSFFRKKPMTDFDTDDIVANKLGILLFAEIISLLIPTLSIDLSWFWGK